MSIRANDMASEIHTRITTLHGHHAFWYISMPSLHDYDKKCDGKENKEEYPSRTQFYNQACDLL